MIPMPKVSANCLKCNGLSVPQLCGYNAPGIVAYGSAARAARDAIETMRAKRIKVGLIELKTIWPFPDNPIKKLAYHTKAVFVAENNMGQLIPPDREVLTERIDIIGVQRYDGRPLEPMEIIRAVKEEIYA